MEQSIRGCGSTSAPRHRSERPKKRLRKADRRSQGDPLVYTIPAHRSFADALAAGLIAEYSGDPLALARGRILLPTNRAVRTLTEAFVRSSGSGLVLPRLIPIGDPELDDRIGTALDPLETILPPAVDPLDRLLNLANLVRAPVWHDVVEERACESLKQKKHHEPGDHGCFPL